METQVYKYCFIVMAAMVANELAAQTTTAVPFKDIHKNGATDNFTIREIKKKELQIAPSKLVILRVSPKI